MARFVRLLCLVLPLVGCGAALRVPLRTGPAPMLPAEAAERLALGSPTIVPGRDEVTELDRLARLARLASRLEQRATAIDAVTSLLHLARAGAIARPSPERLARRRDAEALAVSIADRFDDAGLVTSLAESEHAPVSLDVLTHALAAHLPGPPLRREVWDRLGAEGRAHAEWSGRRPVDVAPIPIDDVRSLGAAGAPHLVRRIGDAAVLGDVATVRAAARALREVDADGPLSLALGALMRELDAGVLDDETLLFVATWVESSRSTGGAVARAMLARQAHPSSEAIPAALALALYGTGAFFDAQALARTLTPSDDGLRRLLATIDALTDAHRGDAAPLSALLDREPGVLRSTEWLRLAANAADEDDFTDPVTRVVIRMRRAAPIYDRNEAYFLAIDDGASEELRRRAIDALAPHEPDNARVVAGCLAEGVSADACEARLDAVDALLAGGEPDLFGRLGPAVSERVLWLREEPPSTELAAIAGPWLDERARTTAGWDGGWVWARAELFVVLGDADGLRALLDERGALLTPDELAGARVALAGIEAGAAPALFPLTLPALVLLPSGAPPDAIEITAGIACARPSAVSAECAAQGARIAEAAPDHWAAARVLFAIEEGAPFDLDVPIADSESLAAVLLDGLRAEARGDAATAADRFLRARIASPVQAELDRRYLTHAVAAGLPVAQAVEAASAAWVRNPFVRDLSRVIAEAGADEALAHRLLAEELDAFAELGERATGVRAALVNGGDLVADALRTAPDAATAGRLAQLYLPFVRALDRRTDARILHVEVALLAGQPGEAGEAADRPARDERDSLPLLEVSDLRDLIGAAAVLGPALTAHVLLARPRSSDAASTRAFLAPIEAAAARDPRLSNLLCGEYVRAGDAERAMAACAPLARIAPSPPVTFRVGWAITSGATLPPGLDPDAFFTHARESTRGTTLAGLAWNDALRLADLGRREESSRAALEALAAGHVPGGVGAWEDDQADLRGAEIRSRAGDAEQNRIYLALASGEAELAERYAEAAQRRMRRDPDDVDEEAWGSVFMASDLAAWAAADVREGHIDGPALVIWDRLRRDSFRDDDAMAALAAEHPEALVVALAIAVRESDHGRHREAYEAIQPILERAPRATLGVVFRRSIGLAASRAEADETVARLRALYPDDPRLVEEDVRAALPAELASPEALEAFLTGLPDDELARLPRPRVRTDPTGHAIAAFPGNAVPLDGVFGAQAGPVRLLVSAEPRLAHCEGEACLDGMLSSFDAMGMTPIWHAPASTTAGDGARALIAGPSGAGLFSAIPRGSVLFLVGVFGAPEAIASRLRSYALLERSMVPTDVVVPSAWAAAVVEAGAPWRPSTAGDDAARQTEDAALVLRHVALVRAWSTANVEGTSCPLASELDTRFANDAIGRTEAVLRLFLGTADPVRRRALLRCVDVHAPGASALGVAALLDPSPESHRLGATLLAADPAPARALVEELAAIEPGRPLSGVAHRDSDLPPFSAVELLLALPETERRAVTEALWRGANARGRAIAVVTEQMRAGSLDHALVRDVLHHGSAEEAMTAADVLYGTLEAADLEAARARLDGLVAPVDEASRRLAVRLIWELARRLDPADEDRFARVAMRLRETASRGDEDTRRLFEWTAEQIEQELAVLRASHGGALPEEEDARREVEASLEIYRGMRGLTTRRRTSARVAQMLATESLARVLPGSHWSYVRVPSPSLLITTLRAMYERLESGSASDGALARQILSSILERSNAALLGPDGGLDLTRPVECATADRFPRSWVCAVYVADRDRVETLLAERRYGTNSGAWLAVEAARQARSLPIAAGGMPYELAEMLEDAPPSAPPRVAAVVLRERARTDVDLDGVHVLRYGTFVAREGDDTGVDTEHYLFTGDRLVMFGLEEAARAILAEPLPAARTLAGQPGFRALTEGWTDGAVLQLVNVGFRTRMLPAPLPDGDMGLELSAWDEGLVARIRMPFTEPSPSVADLVARLPEGALSSMAFVPDDDQEPPEPRTEPPAHDEWRGYLLARSTRFALGWYGASRRADLAPSARVWGDWVLVLSPSEALSRELSGWSLLPTEGRTIEREGIRFGRTGDTLVVATSDALLTSALGSHTAPPATLVGSGRMDGVHTAETARSLASTLRRDDGRREELELLAAILGLSREVSFEATADARRRELVLTARVTPNLGPPGDGHDLIDELLRNARNAVVLPRALTASEVRSPLRLVITTSEPEVVATRGFGGSDRVRAEVRDATTLHVTIAPAAAGPTALTELERAGLLSSTAQIRADSDRVVERARALAPPGTPPAEAARAIVTWVHDHVRYELTAEELDAATVLERGRGDCTELARVTTALLRAAGVPAEMREGFLVVGAEMGAHAWVAYHDGTMFREIDPTAGRADVDAGYVPSSVLTLMGLAAIGDLRITEVTAAP